MNDLNKRCVSLDWLEVYVLESRVNYPCNAEYFRNNGYYVCEREYGTRQYKEMFVIEDEHGDAWIEIRRNPASGDASFSGLVPESSHIRLVNRQCYFSNAVSKLREFLVRHDYIFKRIYRIDICLDFERFDYGDDPSKFTRRYLARKYSKINQTKIATHGADNWSDFDWETLSWGSRTSMVSTKMYNKSKELTVNKTDKPYIKWIWFQCGLIDSPTTMEKRAPDGHIYKPDIWRIEFSLKSSADNWIIIEDVSGKHTKKKAVPHRLDMFDSPDKLWQRFQDLAYHYFRFKKRVEGLRKDRCPDKRLFRFDKEYTFMQVKSLPNDSKPVRNDELLRRRLTEYRHCHADPELRKAIDVILQALDEAELERVSPREALMQTEVLRKTIAIRLGYKYEDAAVTIERIKQLVSNNDIW